MKRQIAATLVGLAWLLGTLLAQGQPARPPQGGATPGAAQGQTRQAQAAAARDARDGGRQEAAGNPTASYEIQPGDVLQVSVWKEADLTQEVLVRPDGGFSFPLAGDVDALGKTVEQLRVELTERLSRFVPDLFVTVAVQEINGNKVYVIGQVNQPGEFVVNPRVDVMQALSLAGGTTAFASPNDIFVLRRENGGQTRLPFNFSDVLRGRSLEQNVILRSGDVVVVP